MAIYEQTDRRVLMTEKDANGKSVRGEYFLFEMFTIDQLIKMGETQPQGTLYSRHYLSDIRNGNQKANPKFQKTMEMMTNISQDQLFEVHPRYE